MSLAVGTRLGHYEVVRQIGVGGMGEVYGATDPRLGRSVAIKVLPPELRAHADRLRRFEQEARTIGALNHPNLLTLHDVGEYDGSPYLVTELLDGRSLRARLTDGALPLREVLRISREIARGLAAAHTAGVVHRDIKPDNLFITADDRVKILDFGIAKLRDDAAPGGSDPAMAATAALPASGTVGTGTGMVVGTPGYMAPEQLAGKPVDPRTDIFALGVVIYEMVVGRRPFAGETSVEEQYAILKGEPLALPPYVPGSLERIILRCLEKRPDARFQSASDLAFALDSTDGTGEMPARHTPIPSAIASLGSAPTALGTPLAVPVPTDRMPQVAAPATSPGVAAAAPVVAPVVPARSPRLWQVLAAASLAIAGGAVAWSLHREHGAPHAAGGTAIGGPGPVFRRVTFHPRDQWFARFDAKGKNVLYSLRGSSADDWKMYRGGIERPSIEPVSIPGRVLAISTDDEIAASLPWTGGKGGSLIVGRPGEGTALPLGYGYSAAAWSPDGKALAATRHANGTEQPETAMFVEYPLKTQIVKQANGSIPYLAVSPDGKYVAYCSVGAGHDAQAQIVIVDAHGGEVTTSPRHELVRGIAWSPDGKAVWFSTPSGVAEQSAIRSYGLDGHEHVLLHTAGGMALLDVARDGRMLVTVGDEHTHLMIGGRSDRKLDVAWFDGSDVQAISRDGTTIAFVEMSGTGQTNDGHATYLRTGKEDPVLVGQASRIALLPDAPTPDGRGAKSMVEMQKNTLVRAVIGQETAQLPMGPVATLDQSDHMATSWDGRFLVVRGKAKGEPAARLWLWDLQHAGEPHVIGPAGTVNEKGYHPISPDGKWVAVTTGKTIQLVSTDADGAAHDLATPDPGEGAEPLSFSDDGTKLLAMSAHRYPRKIYRLDLATPGATWEPWTELEVNARTAELESSTSSKAMLFEPAFSGDGETVAYSFSTELSDVYVLEPPADPAK